MSAGSCRDLVAASILPTLEADPAPRHSPTAAAAPDTLFRDAHSIARAKIGGSESNGKY